ncbi:hypothetical protein [Tahibacter amnicola]|uniref:Uncharacterized protein n=1 Tax=Tahibacter amnicola TaxID=2976241 RepID=A0ABY6B9J6_9GAMM|nr:hypothetical protein [Tahibacter amnicola]UXI66524.1 hypothetical protein N4264_17440 [Tahibacter amnicola]
MKKNRALVVGGVLSFVAALLHVGCILGGPAWYRFFGAGEGMATMAEQGSPVPALLTLGITAVLVSWGCYAWSGAGLMRRLPLLRTALVGISAVYLLRGLILVPAAIIKPDAIDAFAIWSSLICLVYGLFHAIGTWQVWPRARP